MLIHPMQWKNPTTVTCSEINDTLALVCKILCNHILLEPYHPEKISYKCSENTSMDRVAKQKIDINRFTLKLSQSYSLTFTKLQLCYEGTSSVASVNRIVL